MNDEDSQSIVFMNFEPEVRMKTKYFLLYLSVTPHLPTDSSSPKA